MFCRITTADFIFKFETSLYIYIHIKFTFVYKYYIYVISFIYIAFFIKELESSGWHRELVLIITLLVWKGSVVGLLFSFFFVLSFTSVTLWSLKRFKMPFKQPWSCLLRRNLNLQKAGKGKMCCILCRSSTGLIHLSMCFISSMWATLLTHMVYWIRAWFCNIPSKFISQYLNILPINRELECLPP